MSANRPVTFEGVAFSSVRVTEHTEWTFATVFGNEGAPACSEITCGRLTGEVARTVSESMAVLKGTKIADERRIDDLLGIGLCQLRADRALATAISALHTVLLDLRSQRDGISLTEALGGDVQDGVDLYANINRSLLGGDRSPSTFGAADEHAVKAGFTVVKCAPFDSVQPPTTSADIPLAIRPGIERVAAVRSAVGPDVRVLVDCHGRFEVHAAPLVAQELARLDVGWLEEPMESTTDAAGLVEVAGKVGMPVAGGESGYGESFFEDLVRRRAVRIVMPDIKHCGGAAEACRAGRAATTAGGQVSLHCPTGPVSLLASAHVTAAIPGALPLEHAVDEAPWRAELLDPPERIEGGRLWLPAGRGVGAKLNAEVVSRYGRSWRL